MNNLNSKLQNSFSSNLNSTLIKAAEDNKIETENPEKSFVDSIFFGNANNTVIASIYKIPLDRIEPNPYQPRKTFDEKELSELAEDIKENGLIQKIILINQVDEDFNIIGDKYYIVAGERRYRAFKLLQEQYPENKIYQAIDSIVEKIGDLNQETYKHRLALVALAENLKRSDLNFVDFAEAIVKLKDEFKLTYEELGKKIGKSDGHLRIIASIYGKMSEEQKETARKENLGREAIEKLLAGANKSESKKKSLAGDFYKKIYSDYKKGKTLEYEFSDKVKSIKEIINNFFAKDLEEKEKLIKELLK